MRPNSPTAATAAIIAITILTSALMLHHLGTADVCTGNEAVEAVFVQDMLEHNHLLFPLENDKTPMYKPPLFHWTAVALDRIADIHKVTASNLRLPSALYAILGVILTILFAYRILGADAAILASLALAGSYQYVSQGRYGRVDMTLCFFETLAIYSFVWWLPRDPNSSGRAARADSNLTALYLIAISLGLAVLAKGPVGAILPGASIVIFMILERRPRQLLTMLDPGALIVGAALASSWYLVCYFTGHFSFLNQQLGDENLGRFTGSLGAMVPTYYLKPILLNSAPLSILIPFAAVFALLSPSPSIVPPLPPGEADARASGEGARPRTPSDSRPIATVRLFAIFYFATVIFFTLAAYKRRAYLLPVWPASAILLSWSILTIPPLAYRRAATWTFAALCSGLIIFNFIYIPRSEIRDCRDDSFRPAAAEIARVVAPEDPLYIYGLGEEAAPLLFYLDRDAPELQGKLGDAPAGFIIIPAAVWKLHQLEAPDFEPVLTSDHGNIHLLLIKRGKSYAGFSYLARYFTGEDAGRLAVGR
jgi:4-amino-4-deoxy-L-arabinose transferase-like glycosyltransferase